MFIANNNFLPYIVYIYILTYAFKSIYFITTTNWVIRSTLLETQKRNSFQCQQYQNMIQFDVSNKN